MVCNRRKSFNGLYCLRSDSRVIALRDERNFNDVMHKMSYSMALKKGFLLKMSLSRRSTLIFIAIATKNVHTYRNWVGNPLLPVKSSDRHLQQKLWRVNWTNLYDRSRNQPQLSRVDYFVHVIPLITKTRCDHRSCDFSCTAAQHLYARILNLRMSVVFWVNLYWRVFRLLSIAIVSFASWHCSILFHLFVLDPDLL